RFICTDSSFVCCPSDAVVLELDTSMPDCTSIGEVTIKIMTSTSEISTRGVTFISVIGPLLFPACMPALPVVCHYHKVFLGYRFHFNAYILYFITEIVEQNNRRYGHSEA